MTVRDRAPGPDDEHFHLEPGLALGARRLAIIDVAGGNSRSETRMVGLGRIQRRAIRIYPELRRKLMAAGHRLQRAATTEAWVHLYKK